MITAIATTETPSANGTYEARPYCIPGDLNGFAKWKNPLIDLIAAVMGCRVQFLTKVASGNDNIIMYGESANITGALAIIRALSSSPQCVASKACVEAMKADGVRTSDIPYSVSFYAGFVQGFASLENVKAAVLANANKCATIGTLYPRTNEGFPQHSAAKVDDRISQKGFGAALVATYNQPASKAKPAPAKPTVTVNVTPQPPVATPAPIAIGPAVELAEEIAQHEHSQPCDIYGCSDLPESTTVPEIVASAPISASVDTYATTLSKARKAPRKAAAKKVAPKAS